MAFSRSKLVAAASAVMIGMLLVGCSSSGVDHPADRSSTAGTTSSAITPTAAKQVRFGGVQVTIPGTWPVIDGAHAHYTCSATFTGQADRAFAGASNQGVPSCPGRAAGERTDPADGVWLQPSTATTPQGSVTLLPSGQHVYVTLEPSQSAIGVWYHGVSIQIGIGPDPDVEQAILHSITTAPTTANTPVLGACPTPAAGPPDLPTPTRARTTQTLEDSNGRLEPALATVVPKVSAAAVWASFLRSGFAGTGNADELRWSIVFGNYSALSLYRDVPTWLIEGKGIETDYGPCGVTILAPYNADTGQSMGVTTLD